MDKKIIAEKIKHTVISVDSTAQIVLFGSQARGEASKESDWDILILLNRPNVTLKDEQNFRHKLFEVELETGEVISTFVYSLNDWNTKMTVTPLYENVKRDGVSL